MLSGSLRGNQRARFAQMELDAMTGREIDKSQGTKEEQAGDPRRERLSRALRANLRRRKTPADTKSPHDAGDDQDPD